MGPCCRSNKNQTAGQQRSCASRMLGCCGEKSLMGAYTGKRYDEDTIETQMRFKSLSFYDFDEDKKPLTDSTAMNFDDSENDDAVSEFQSVDEGAIAVMSMDEIRNMRDMQLDYEICRRQYREEIAQSQAFVRPLPGQNLENLAPSTALDDKAENLDFEIGNLLDDQKFAVIQSLGPPETPRPSASAELVTVTNQSAQLDSAHLQNKLNAFVDLEKMASVKKMEEDKDNELDTGDIGSTKDFNDNATVIMQSEVNISSLGTIQSLQMQHQQQDIEEQPTAAIEDVELQPVNDEESVIDEQQQTFVGSGLQ